MNEQLAALTIAMEVLPDALLIVDRQHQIVGCNRFAERLFGYQHGELIDTSVHELLPERAREAHKKHIEAFNHTGGERPMSERPVLHGLAKDGTRIALSIGISAVGEGEDRLFVAVVRDARSFDDTLRGTMLLAETDPLTDLGNRRYLSARLEEFQQSNGTQPIGLLFLDLNRFKPLNDQYGHEVGDEVLRIVAARLRSSLRDTDLCVRLGGDEFAVLTLGITDSRSLERIALNVHSAITAPIRVKDHIVTVGVSIGGVLGYSSSAEVDSLFDRADRAMYRAKADAIPYAFDGANRESAA